MSHHKAWAKFALRRPVAVLGLGGSYGNRHLFMPTSRESDLLGVWARSDRFHLGSLHLYLLTGGQALQPTHTVFAASHQSTFYRRGGLSAKKTVFLPYGTTDDERVFVRVRLHNHSRRHRVVDLPVELWWSAREFPGLKVPAAGEQSRSFRQTLIDGRLQVEAVDRPEATADLAASLPAASVSLRGSRSSLNYRVPLAPGESRTLTVVLTFRHDGIRPPLREPGTEAGRAWRETNRSLSSQLADATIWTPNPRLNRGLYWSKVNLLRVQHDYLAGPGFTNDPPQDIVVLRDAAWFIAGADYLTPHFDREMLRLLFREGVSSDGKVAEYLRLSREPLYREDYGLNVNDDAPLMILAAVHHYYVTGDRGFLTEVYPTLTRIARYLLSQSWQGLVYTQPGGQNVWGISGWRNIIPDYSLDGAVTEINAETLAALKELASLAREVGREAEASEFTAAATALAGRIESDLRREDGLYLLARDAQGRRRRNLTGDLVFPVLFGPAGPESREKILSLLHSEEFWVEGGCRTVSPTEADYHPDEGCQLLGGTWPNLMAWVAFAGREEHPSWPAEALERTWQLSEDPHPAERGHVVPGQFPERLHGETGASRGMALSPWMPPTYLWLGVEGLAGVSPGPGPLRVAPHLPPDWTAVAVRRLAVRGHRLSFFWHEGRLYATESVESPWPVEVFPEEVTDEYQVTGAFHLALRRPGLTQLFLAGRGPVQVTGPDTNLRLNLEGPTVLNLSGVEELVV